MLQRVLTAAVLSAVALAAVFSAHWLPIVVLSVLAFAMGFTELDRLVGFGRWRGFSLAWGLLSAIGSAVAYPAASLAPAWTAMALGLVGLWHALARNADGSPLRPLVSAWLGVPCGLAVAMHQSSLAGPGPVTANALILLLVPIWVGDVAALFVGRAVGRRLLAPKVSPKKTWEGAVANFVACTLAAVALVAFLGAPWWAGAAVGALAGLVGQVGDLLQSALKRIAGLKDSGGVLPGHGGVLDRLDSAMLAFLPCAQVLLALAPELFSRPR